MMKSILCLSPLFLLLRTVSAFNYGLTGEIGAMVLTDYETSISDIRTLFTNEITLVTVTGVTWEPNENNSTDTSDILRWETSVDGIVQSTGTIDLSTLGERELLDTIPVGNVTVTSNGRVAITVNLFVDNTTATTSNEYEAYAAGVAIVPLIIVLILALTTQMVEVSLFCAIFVGACMVTGNIKDGFKTTLDDYILNALANVDHAYVYLFTLILSGMVGMMEKSGGMIGFTQSIAKYATTSKAGQWATFAIGCVIFFDDYANTLLAGETMRPLTDLLMVSREKLSFLVDATAAPIASISPISSWVGFEVGLIQTEIDRIVLLYGIDNVTIETSGLAVFFQSIKYRYYPIFMLILIPVLIFSGRDFGPMLIAERKVRVYNRIDGGDGRGKADHKMSTGENEPRQDTPKRAYNMLIPIVLLVFFIFYLLVTTGDDGSGTQSFMDKIEDSDSYSALLWGTMAAAILSLMMYMAQFVQDGGFVLPTFTVLKAICLPARCNRHKPALVSTQDVDDGQEVGDAVADEVVDADDEGEDNSGQPRSLLNLHECVESLLYGMGRIFPALIVLTLAWASGSIMIAVGADRLFSRWIVGGVSPSALPTLSFVISLFMALATGTSWGTMTILFPLICLPTYEVSNGDAQLFYATIAGILSGSVAGDHMSPISDTTVLSALASDCKLINHVNTQAPYAIVCVIFAILFGTLPIGGDAWHNMIGIALATLTIILYVYGMCVPILSPTGRYDILTQLILMCNNKEGSDLYQLKQDCIRACQADTIVEEEAKDFKNKVNHDTEPKDQTEKTMIGDPSGRALEDKNDSDQEETNINEVSEEYNL